MTKRTTSGRRGWVDELWNALAPSAEPRLLDKGDVLFRDGDPIDGLYLIEEGRVRLAIRAKNSRKVNIRLARGRSIVGLGPLFSKGTSNSTAEVLAPSRVGFVPRLIVEIFLEEHPAIRLPLLRGVTEDVTRCNDLIRPLGRAA